MLALQMNFVQRDGLIQAMHTWTLNKQISVGQILLEQGAITKGQLEALDLLVVEHLLLHDNDPQQSLRTLTHQTPVAPRSTPATLEEFEASLVQSGSSLPTKSDDRSPADLMSSNRYSKIRLHARGGLGEIFVAQDLELHREVALKEIMTARVHDTVSRLRFILEAEITGRLEHPGIVPVYGLGVYPDGRPFYAMRLIQGETLKSRIKRFHETDGAGRDPAERSLAFRGLLRHLNDACNAVAYAHSRGILHRDLKPANIMVGKFGETLIVDWGLAKACHNQRSSEVDGREVTIDAPLRLSSGSDILATRAGSALGTLGFMSPEQAEGKLDELGAATDIYSLGATLYVILTGKKPFSGANEAEILAQVKRCEFPPPHLVKSSVPGGLEAICLKAMAADPAYRYGSALDLAAEVEHWLADEPVGAYAEPWTKRSARWARRHQTALSAAAVFLVSALLALTAITALAIHGERATAIQKQRAEENLEIAMLLNSNGIALIESAESAFAAIPTLHENRKGFLVTASRAFRQRVAENPDNDQLRERAAHVYRYTANVYRLCNEVDDAVPLYRDSVSICQSLVDRQPQNTSRREMLSGTLRDQAKLKSNRGDLRGAATTLENAIEIARTLQREDETKLSYRRTLGAALLNLSVVQLGLGEDNSGSESAKEAGKLFEQTLSGKNKDERPYDRILLAASVQNEAIAERELKRFDSALKRHEAALAMLKPFRERTPEGIAKTDVSAFWASFTLDQCRTLAKAGYKDLAEKELQETTLQWETLARDYPQIPSYREGMAAALIERANLCLDAGRAGEARTAFTTSKGALEQLHRTSASVPGISVELAKAYAGLARCERAPDKAQAVEWYAKAKAALHDARTQSPDSVQLKRLLASVDKAIEALQETISH
jgi:serine/threonine-protein kinase